MNIGTNSFPLYPNAIQKQVPEEETACSHQLSKHPYEAMLLLAQALLKEQSGKNVNSDSSVA